MNDQRLLDSQLNHRLETAVSYHAHFASCSRSHDLAAVFLIHQQCDDIFRISERNYWYVFSHIGMRRGLVNQNNVNMVPFCQCDFFPQVNGYSLHSARDRHWCLSAERASCEETKRARDKNLHTGHMEMAPPAARAFAESLALAR